MCQRIKHRMELIIDDSNTAYNTEYTEYTERVQSTLGVHRQSTSLALLSTGCTKLNTERKMYNEQNRVQRLNISEYTKKMNIVQR